MEKTMEQLIHRLLQAEVFSKLPRDECVRLATMAQHRAVATGCFLCHQGDSWPYLVFVASGKLRWTLLSAGGQECFLYATGAGQLTWGHTIFDGEPMPACIIAQSESDIYQWAGDQIVPVLARFPAALWDVQRIQVQAARRATEMIYSLAFQPVAGRLAGVLLDRFAGQENLTVGRDLTLNEIAVMVASSPEVVCRVLQHFRSEGILDVTRNHMTLYNRNALQRLVEMA
jgi:CRP/FNR family transcriptional regulator, cyclic AMP receptor protein